jgi:hypothetical protein
VHDESLARNVDKIASNSVTQADMLSPGAAVHESFLEHRLDPNTLQQMEVPLYSTGRAYYIPTQAVHGLVTSSEASGNRVFFQESKAESPRATFTMAETQDLLRVYGDL